MGRFKPNSMFSRLMVLFTVVILVSMGFLSIIFTTTIRNQQINDRLTQLQSQAEEVVELVEKRYEYQTKMDRPWLFSNVNTLGYHSIERQLQNKIKRIANEFDAYVIIDQKIYYLNQNAQSQTPQVDMKIFGPIMIRVKEGEMVSTRIRTEEGSSKSMFVVGVPWRDTDKQVQGVAIIYTSAQVLEATYKPLLTRVLGITVIAFWLAVIFAYIFTKEMINPLKSMVKASGAMARGDFRQKAEVEGSEEIIQLAESFNSMAEQLEQLENSRREFVANVSHELRSPITSIHGFVQGMQDGTIPEEEHPKYLQIVSEETTRLSKLISELLQLSRMEQGHETMTMNTFDINELIRRVLLRRYNDIEQKNIEMEVDFEQEHSYVVGDGDAIEQVVVNLLDNAIKFTPEKGMIWLGTKEENKKIQVFVEDDGQGIAQEDLTQIFERFYKVDKAHTPGHGTGLGLSISKRIMDTHGEKIWAESGGGKTGFYFTLEKGKKED